MRRNGTDWSDVTFIHATRWQDEPLAQVGYGASGYPNPNRSKAWEIWRDRGAHVSIAVLIEMQMRHGMPPFQLALDHGILPSLSPDVDTNMTTDPFSLMRGAFTLQRALANDLAFPESNPGGLPVPQLVTSRQVIEMATIAGAASNRILDKVGTLTPGKEADIVVLDARNINTWPMNNVPGTIVTMMNPRHVRDVLIAGRSRVLEGQTGGLERRCPAAPDRASPRARPRAHQRDPEARSAAAGQQQLRGALPPELPRRMLREGAEHDGAGVCVEALSAQCSPDWRRSRKSGNGGATDCGCPGFSLRFNPGYACWPEAAIPPRSRAAPRLRRLRVRPLLQGLGDAIGEGLDRADIGLRRLVGFGAVLFPIAQGRERDAVTLAELFLGETQPRPHELHARKWFHPRKLGVGQRLRIGIGQRRRVNLRVGHGVGARPVEIVRTDPCGFLHDSAFVPLVPPASPRSGAAVAGSYM